MIRHESIIITPEILRLVARIDEFKGAWHRGKYKTSANNIAAYDAQGQQVAIVFETVSPFDTPPRMTELVAWLRDQRESEDLHPLLVVAVFTVVFLEIHPFQDGNGRLSRALTTLLLLQFGYSYTLYCSLERVIEQRKDAYYLALRQTQGTIRTANPDWQPWLTFFLQSLVEQILEFARQHGRITMADAMTLTGSSRNTLKQHFRKLAEQGTLTQHGKGRGVWYSLG